nr:hypothetical protein [Leptospira bouyouniensis]
MLGRIVSARFHTIPALLYLLFVLFPIVSVSSQTHKNRYGFLYIDSNSGQSSGGHSALLLGDRVYHLQYSFEDQIFHIVRESWDDFRFQYGVVENRNIEFYEWNLSNSAKQILRQRWNELYLVQETHIQNQKNLEEDWEWMRDNQENNPFPDLIIGFGYFTNREDPHSPIPKLFSFRKNELEYLKKNIETISDQSSQTKWEIKDDEISLPETNSPLHLIPTIETETNLHIQNQRKIFVRMFLQNPVLLYEQAFVKLEGKNFSLTHEEAKIWKGYLPKLVNELKVCILENSCKDWEEMTLLLRILYIQKSIEVRQIVFPKKNFTGFSYLEYTELPESTISTKQKEYETIFIEKRKEFGKGYHPIQFYNWETFLSHFQSFIEAKTFTEGIEFNLVGQFPYPKTRNSFLKQGSNEKSKQSFKQWEMYSYKIQNLYSYHLVFQNCTNELFHYLNLMFPEGKIGEEKFWDPLSENVFVFNFIPSIAAKKLHSSPYTKDFTLYPSYRNLKRNTISNWKEKNIVERFVPSSKIYKPNPMDHSFLFFTEESVWNRPLFGMANLMWGIGYTSVGIVKSPFDRGKDVSKGSETIFYSLPELFFFNIRKGHFPLISAEEIPEEYYEKETK